MKDFVISHADNISFLVIAIICIVGAILVLGLIEGVADIRRNWSIKSKNPIRIGSSTVIVICPDCQRKYKNGEWRDYDPEYIRAVKTVIKAGQASTSLLQRQLHIGYTKAARIMKDMEFGDIISAPNGSQSRKVLIGSIDELDNTSKTNKADKPDKPDDIGLTIILDKKPRGI